LRNFAFILFVGSLPTDDPEDRSKRRSSGIANNGRRRSSIVDGRLGVPLYEGMEDIAQENLTQLDAMRRASLKSSALKQERALIDKYVANNMNVQVRLTDTDSPSVCQNSLLVIFTTTLWVILSLSLFYGEKYLLLT